MLGRLLLLGFAVAASLVGSVPSTVAARDPAGGPEVLWEAFPFNPTGERIVFPVAPKGTFRPPVPETAAAPSSGANASLLTVIGAGAAALLAAVALASVLMRLLATERGGPTHGHKQPSAYISAVFVGTRYLPVIEGSIRRKRRSVRRADIVPVLVGSAVAIAIALLTVRFVG